MWRKILLPLILLCLLPVACTNQRPPIDIPPASDIYEDPFFTKGWAQAWQFYKKHWGLAGEKALVKDLEFTLRGTDLYSLRLVVLAKKEEEWRYYYLRLERGLEPYDEQGEYRAHVDIHVLTDADELFQELAAHNLEDWAYPEADFGLVELVQEFEEGFVFSAEDGFEAGILADGEKKLLKEGEKFALDGRHILFRSSPVGGADSMKRVYLMPAFSGVMEKYNAVLPLAEDDLELVDFRWKDLDGDGKREEVLFCRDDKNYYLDIVAGTEKKRYELLLPEAIMGAEMTLRDLTGNGIPEFIFEEHVGGSGAITYLSAYKLVDKQLKVIFRSKDYAQLHGLDNAYLGENRVRVAVNSLAKAWEYELLLSAYDTSDETQEKEIKERFAKQWVDSFSGYELLDLEGDGRVEILAGQIVCGIAHADVVGKIKQVFSFNGEKYERSNLELYRFIPCGEERVEEKTPN